MRLMRTHSQNSQPVKSMDFWEQNFKLQWDTLLLKSSQFLPPSIPELNSVDVSMKLEINRDAVHAGPSELLKLSQIDSALPPADQPMLFFPQKTWLSVTTQTWAAKVDGWTTLGSTSRAPVPQLTHANHTLLVVELPLPVRTTAPMVKPSNHTSAPKDPLLKLHHQLKSNPKSTNMVQWKLVSPYIRTSSHTKEVSINTPQEAWLVDTLSRSLVGVKKMESTTGCAPTPGVPAGEKVDSSESLGDNVTSTVLCTLAHLNSDGRKALNFDL